MKIYWKNILWNYTARYWHLIKYYWRRDYKSRWKSFYYPHKLITTDKQKDKILAKLDAAMEECEFNSKK